MRKKDFYDLEDQIRDTVKDAFDAIDFDRLKNDIDDKADIALSKVKIKLKNKSNHFKKKIKNKRYNLYDNDTNITEKDENKVQRYICKRPAGSLSGIFYMILGYIGSSALGILIITYLIFAYVKGKSSIANFTILGFLFSFFVLSIILTLNGISLRKRVKRFRKYVSYMDNHNYCSIEKLSEAIRRKNKFVVKDLKKMIDLGMFPQAHIDDNETYFMLNNEVYDNYLSSQEALKHRNEDELKKQQELNEEINNPKEKELKHTIEMGKNYIEQIRSVNNAIQKEEISTKLNRLENIVGEIFNYVENNPKKLAEVNKFTNHYLPITLKLVNAYKELDYQPVQGNNIKNAKNEIEKTIDTINIAFEKMLDGLFEEVALDISTDISVLETLFTQEGLTKNDFEK